MMIDIHRVFLFTIIVLLILFMGLSGCGKLGPRAVIRDRSEYGNVIGNSWKDQTLLNIVKTRYGDLPVFLDIGQIVAGYSVESKTTLGYFDGVAIGTEGFFSDHPTITYTPLMGPKFIRELLSPIPPHAIFLAVESYYPADIVFSIAVASMNGMRNHKMAGRNIIEGDKEFFRALHLLHELQLTSKIGIRIKPDEKENKNATLELIFKTENITPQVQQNINELKDLLNLNSEQNHFTLTFGSSVKDESVISLHTRSVFQIMSEFAAQIDVPAQDSSEGRAYRSTANDSHKLLRIKCSPILPKDAFVAIKYRNTYYWIDDRDQQSKRVFGYLMFILSISDTSSREEVPILSIPVR